MGHEKQPGTAVAGVEDLVDCAAGQLGAPARVGHVVGMRSRAAESRPVERDDAESEPGAQPEQ